MLNFASFDNIKCRSTKDICYSFLKMEIFEMCHLRHLQEQFNSIQRVAASKLHSVTHYHSLETLYLVSKTLFSSSYSSKLICQSLPKNKSKPYLESSSKIATTRYANFFDLTMYFTINHLAI